MKVLMRRIVEKTITFRSNHATNSIMRKQLENGEFVKSAIDQDVPNTTHYWMEKKRDVFAMIRQLGKPTAFLTMSASEIHWKRLVALLEKLKVQGNPELQRPLEGLWLIDASDLMNNDQNLCLADFVADYSCNNRAKRYDRKDRPYIIRYRHYTIDDPIDYKREQVLLFHAFKREVGILDNKFETIYGENLDNIVAKQKEYVVRMDYKKIMNISRSIISEESERAVGTNEDAEASLNVRVDYDQDRDILNDPEYVASIQSDSPCAAVRKQTDVYTREEFYSMMQLINAEQYEVIREVID